MGDAGPQRPEGLQKSLDTTKVSYMRVGTSGLKLSVPILGAMSFGHKDWQPWVVDDQAEVEKLLLAAWDRGLNTWDTANVYSNGVSEQMIGEVVKKNKLDRKKLVILTKCYGTVGEDPATSHIKYPELKGTKDYVNQGGLSRAAIFNAVEASLERLQMDYIDLLQIHRYDCKCLRSTTG
jgi:aryl-alcohol dehydrogenase-like predicted oxidoreductase